MTPVKVEDLTHENGMSTGPQMGADSLNLNLNKVKDNNSGKIQQINKPLKSRAPAAPQRGKQIPRVGTGPNVPKTFLGTNMAHGKECHTLPEINSSHLKIGHLKRKGSYSNHPFSGVNSLASFQGGHFYRSRLVESKLEVASCQLNHISGSGGYPK